MNRTALLVGLLALGGCRGAPSAPADDAARAALQPFFRALIDQEWANAHAQLHPAERARLPLAKFTNLAKIYRRNVGFEPVRVQIRSCEEHGDTATAHIVWLGQHEGQQHYRDALTLRKDGSAWGVVLPAKFGEAKRR